MRPSRVPSILALVAVVLLAGTTVRPSRADDPPPAKGDAPPKPSADEETAKWLDELKGRVAKQEESDATAAIQRLVGIWADKALLPETKKPVPDLLERYAKDDDKPAVVLAAIEAIGTLGSEAGGKSLCGILERALKAKTPSMDVCGACLRGLKKLADPAKGTTDLLLDLLKRKENDLVGRAADAISGYKDAPGKLRKELVEEVLKTAESVFQASRDGKDSAAVTKWNVIQSGVMSALRSLTSQNFSDPVVARRWFNDHKKDAKAWS